VRRPLPGCAPRFHKTTTQTSNPSHGLTLTLPLPLADAYAGQNTKIRDTLNNLILKSPQNWQTSVGLPFFQIEGTVVEWDE